MQNQTEVFGLLIAFLTIFLTIVLFILWRKKKSSGQFILLTGLCNSGKTLIYSRLNKSKFVNTYTSVRENVGEININNQTLKIVDIPGHERLRYKYFDKYKNSLRGLVFVIDSESIQKDTRDAAEFLYNLLADPVMTRKVSILILCNKIDEHLSKGCAVIKTLLEKEINLLRVTKASQLEDIEPTVNHCFLGKDGKDFEFSDLANNVQFAESSAFIQGSENANLEDLVNWLQKFS